MALHILLVALVATLGLDLPSIDGLEACGQSGRAWVAARGSELAGFGIEAGRGTGGDLPTNPAAGTAPVRVDLAFEAATEAMASGFSADLAATGPGPTIGASSAPAEPDAEVDLTPQGSRLEKLSEAVRLTRRAVDAWSELIKPAVDDARGDSF